MLSNLALAKSHTVSFAQLTDIHYSPDGITSSSRDLSKSKANLGFAITSLNKHSKDIDFVMFLGDNIDKSRTDSMMGFLKETQNVEKPHYFVLGNHDAYKLSGIPKEQYIKAVQLYNPYQKSDKPSYYFYPDKNTIAIVVDGAMQFAPSAHGTYTEETIKWLDNVLTENQDKVALIFQHFPLIPPYENFSHRTLEADPYFDLLIKHKNIALISSGHYHDEKVTIDKNGIYHISVPSLLSEPNIYEIVKVTYEKKIFKTPTEVKVEIKKIRI